MKIKDLINAQIVHPKFGSGSIVSTEADKKYQNDPQGRITIQFEDGTKKQFNINELGNFLSLKDKELQKQLDEALSPTRGGKKYSSNTPIDKITSESIYNKLIAVRDKYRQMRDKAIEQTNSDLSVQLSNTINEITGYINEISSYSGQVAEEIANGQNTIIKVKNEAFKKVLKFIDTIDKTNRFNNIGEPTVKINYTPRYRASNRSGFKPRALSGGRLYTKGGAHDYYTTETGRIPKGQVFSSSQYERLVTRGFRDIDREIAYFANNPQILKNLQREKANYENPKSFGTAIHAIQEFVGHDAQKRNRGKLIDYAAMAQNPKLIQATIQNLITNYGEELAPQYRNEEGLWNYQLLASALNEASKTLDVMLKGMDVEDLQGFDFEKTTVSEIMEGVYRAATADVARIKDNEYIVGDYKTQSYATPLQWLTQFLVNVQNKRVETGNEGLLGKGVIAHRPRGRGDITAWKMDAGSYEDVDNFLKFLEDNEGNSAAIRNAILTGDVKIPGKLNVKLGKKGQYMTFNGRMAYAIANDKFVDEMDLMLMYQSLPREAQEAFVSGASAVVKSQGYEAPAGTQAFLMQPNIPSKFSIAELRKAGKFKEHMEHGVMSAPNRFIPGLATFDDSGQRVINPEYEERQKKIAELSKQMNAAVAAVNQNQGGLSERKLASMRKKVMDKYEPQIQTLIALQREQFPTVDYRRIGSYSLSDLDKQYMEAVQAQDNETADAIVNYAMEIIGKDQTESNEVYMKGFLGDLSPGTYSVNIKRAIQDKVKGLKFYNKWYGEPISTEARGHWFDLAQRFYDEAGDLQAVSRDDERKNTYSPETWDVEKWQLQNSESRLNSKISGWARASWDPIHETLAYPQAVRRLVDFSSSTKALASVLAAKQAGMKDEDIFYGPESEQAGRIKSEVLELDPANIQKNIDMLLQTNPEFQKLYDFSEKLRNEIYRETTDYQAFVGDDKAELPYNELLKIIFNRVMENIEDLPAIKQMLAQQGVFQVDNYSLDELTQVAGTHGRVIDGKYVPFTESELRNQVQFEKFTRLLGDDTLGHTIWNRAKFGVNWGDQTVAKAFVGGGAKTMGLPNQTRKVAPQQIARELENKLLEIVQATPNSFRKLLSSLDKEGIYPKFKGMSIEEAVHEIANVPSAMEAVFPTKNSDAYWVSLLGGDEDKFRKYFLPMKRKMSQAKNEAYNKTMEQSTLGDAFSGGAGLLDTLKVGQSYYYNRDKYYKEQERLLKEQQDRSHQEFVDKLRRESSQRNKSGDLNQFVRKPISQDVMSTLFPEDVSESLIPTKKSSSRKKQYNQVFEPVIIGNINDGTTGGQGGGNGPYYNYGSYDGSIPKVQVASDIPMSDELRGKKPKATIIGADETTVATIYENAAKRIYADYGPGGLKAWIESHKDADVESTGRELEDILSKVPSYVKNSGALSKAGTMRKDEIMKMIFGDSYQPDSGDNALLEEVKGIHSDTTAIKDFNENLYNFESPSDIDEAQPVDGSNASPNDSLGGGNFTGGGKKPTKESEEQQNDRMRTYIELIKEEYSLLDKVAQLKQEMYAAQQRNEDTSGIQSQIDELNAVKDSVIKEQEVVEEGGFSDKQLARIAAERDVQEQKYRYKAAQYGYNVDTGESRLTVQDQMDNEKQYQTLLSQRLNIQKQILAAEHTIATSYSDKEKNALQEVISILNEKLLLNKEETDNLLTNNNLRKKEQEAIERNYNLELLQVKAQEASKKQGVTNIWDIMANDIKRATMRVIDFGLASKLLNSIPRSITQVAQTITQLEKAMTNLRVVADLNREEAENLMLTYNKLGKQLGATTQEIAEAANDWLRQGYDVAEVNKLIESSTQLAKLGMISQSEATTALTSALKGFKLEASEAASVVDKLTKVDQVAAVSAGGIATALSKSAVSANLAGMSMDKLIAAVSTIGEVTQKSMDSVGEAMKTLLARYGNVKASVFTQIGLDDGGETTDNINDIEKVLRTLGIRVRSSSSEMRSITDVLDELASKWDTLDTVTKNAVSTAFGGTRMRENFLVLMENYSKYQELTEESVKSTGTAEEKYNHYLDSLEASTKRISNAWEEFSMKIESSWIMRTGASAIATITENLGSLLQVILAIAGAGIANKIRSIGGLGQIFGGASNQTKSFFAGFSRHSTYKFDAQGNLIQDKAAPTLTETLNGNGPDSYLGKLVASIDQKVGAIAAKEGTDVGSATGEEAQSISLRSIKEIRAAKKEVKELSSKDLDEAGSMRLSNLKQALAAEKKVRLGNAAVSGVLAGVVSGMSKTEVGGGLFGTLTGNTQTQEATAGDKVVQGMTTAVTTGLVSAIPGIGPLIGPILGPILGDTFGSLITSVLHIEELERKQRVEEAAKQLEVLSGVKTSIEDGAKLISETSFNSANYQKLLDYVESINNFFSEYIDENGSTDDILQDINKELYGDSTEKYLKDISKISSMLLDDNIDTRKETQRALEIALAKEERRETVASQEEDRKTISDVNLQEDVTLTKDNWSKFVGTFAGVGTMIAGLSAMAAAGIQMAAAPLTAGTTAATGAATAAGGAGLIGTGGAILGATWEDRVLHYEGALEDRLAEAEKDLKEMEGSKEYDKFGTFQLDGLRDYIKNLKNAIELNKQVNEALVKQDVNIGYLSADIHDLSDSELQDITTEGVINKITQALEKEGVAVRTLSGAIKSDYLVQIKAMLKADSEMSALFSGDTKTIGELINAEDKLNSVIKASSKELRALGYNIDSVNYEYLRDLLDAGENNEFKKIAESMGLTENKLMSLVYAADPDRIRQFAVAWNITTEKAKELAKEIPSLTTAIGLMNVSEITEQFSKLSDILSDVADNTKLSAENFDTLLKSYPEFASKFFSGGETGLMAALIGDIDTAESKAIQNSIFNSIKGSSTLFEEFRNGLSDDVLGRVDKKWTNIGDLIENVYDKDGNVKSGFEEIDRALRDFLGTEIELEYESQKASMQQELWLHNTEKQIEALNDQKDALKANNEERQKEINLIKAREALENAKKEKKRVYRAGIGWTYEADEEAISNAQENLDELDIERQQDALQVQIDSLTAEKEILENLKENKRFAAMENALNKLNASVNGENSAGLINSIEKANSVIVNPLEQIRDYVASMTEQREGTVEDVGNAYEKLNKAKEALDRAKGTGYLAEKKASENYKEAYNKYQSAYDSALNAGITSAELAEKGYGESSKAYGSYLSTDEGRKYARLAEESIKYITQAEDGNNKWRKKVLYGGIEYNFDSGNDITIGNDKEKYNMFDAIVEEATGAPAKKNAVLYYNGSLYVKRQDNIWAKFKTGEDKYDHNNPMELVGNLGVHAQGTLSAQSGLSLINELGTEGIITPSGTLTALPAKSGVVPADITRNVWQLGEVAPTLIAQLGSLVNQKAFTGTPQSVVNEEGQYIDNLTMNVYPTKDYDMDALLAEARAKVRLTRHNN